MQRVKNVDYDEDDVYSDEEDYGEAEQGYTAEDKQNFASLTPVVNAELEEAGVQVTSTQIEEALWHYYWDVGKSVAYLKNSRTPRQIQQQLEKKHKPRNKFDEAQQKSADIAGEFESGFSFPTQSSLETSAHKAISRAHTSLRSLVGASANHLSADPMHMPLASAVEWFKNTPWSNVAPEDLASITPTQLPRPVPRLLGGSSKLAKLAEERRKKAAAATKQTLQVPASETIGSLDRLSRSKDVKENTTPASKLEPKRYPIRRRKATSPPAREPTSPPEERKEELPDLRSSPTAFGRTLSAGQESPSGWYPMAVGDLLGARYTSSPFEGPSPDDVVSKAQERSKGLHK